MRGSYPGKILWVAGNERVIPREMRGSYQSNKEGHAHENEGIIATEMKGSYPGK